MLDEHIAGGVTPSGAHIRLCHGFQDGGGHLQAQPNINIGVVLRRREGIEVTLPLLLDILNGILLKHQMPEDLDVVARRELVPAFPRVHNGLGAARDGLSIALALALGELIREAVEVPDAAKGLELPELLGDLHDGLGLGFGLFEVPELPR